MESVEDLREALIELLHAAGFTPEMYIIRRHDRAVAVHFDHEGAVDYFRKEVETSGVKEKAFVDKRQDGKRHVAYVQLW